MVLGAINPAARLAAALRGETSELLCAVGETGGALPAAARSSAYQLLRTAHNLELWAQLQTAPPAPRPLDLSANAAAVFEAAREVCATPPGLLRLIPCSRPLPVAASEAAFEAVLLNLLCNSLLYGGPKPAVTLRLTRQGSRAVLLLRDAGPGIPPHRQRAALLPFESFSHLPSVGLGLPLAGAFARRYRGTFTLESRAGGGVSVALSLPLCPAARLPRPPQTTALLADRFSPVYVQLAPRCILPD